jgi:hypothetical protein
MRSARVAPCRRGKTSIPGLRRLLPNIYLIDVVNPSLYRYRLIGTTISNACAATRPVPSPTRRCSANTRTLIIDMYDHVVESRSPIINRAGVSGPRSTG